MSSDSLAMFRKNMGPELGKLAEEHLKHDLQQSDREALQSAARTVSTHASVGSLLGLGLGIYLAFRLRSGRKAMFNTFKTSEQPTALRFASGREQPLPDLKAVLRPSALGDVATYFFLGAGGLFAGGETGLLTGTFRAKSQIGQDRESRERIRMAFRRFQADALRTQADMLEKGDNKGAGMLL